MSVALLSIHPSQRKAASAVLTGVEIQQRVNTCTCISYSFAWAKKYSPCGCFLAVVLIVVHQSQNVGKYILRWDSDAIMVQSDAESDLASHAMCSDPKSCFSYLMPCICCELCSSGFSPCGVM